MIRVESFDNVWDAIEDTPEAAEHMKQLSAMMIALQEHIRHKRWTGREAAQQLDAPEDQIRLLLDSDITAFDQMSLSILCRTAGISADQIAKWR